MPNRQSSNGLSPIENYRAHAAKPIFAERAEVPASKCPTHPSKRQYTDAREAVRAAEARTESIPGGLVIQAYRCDGCGRAHLAKAQNIRQGSLITREDVGIERVELPTETVPGNKDARIKLLSEWLKTNPRPSTAEVAEAAASCTSVARDLMRTLGWEVRRGPYARWEPVQEAMAVTVDKPVDNVTPMVQPPATPLHTSASKHPALSNQGWRPMTGRNVEKIKHLALGDLIDTLAAVGLELRLQVRETE